VAKTPQGTGLPFRATISGLDELAACASLNVSHVLSILDPDFPRPGAFDAFGAHRRLELRFHDVIEDAPGAIAPVRGDVEQVLAFGRTLQAAQSQEAHVLVHCHAGVSRSAATLGLILAQAMPGQPGSAIFAAIVRLRPQVWPNLRIVEMGDSMLQRNGDLIAGVRDLYRRQIERRPEIMREMREGGRGREVMLATAGAQPEDGGP